MTTKKVAPFFINTNICFDKNDASTYEKFLYNVANNTGNSYIAYSVIKMLYGNFRKVDDIRNLWLDVNLLTSKKARYINENFSHVILILQDQIRARDSYLKHIPYKEINDFLEKIKIPFVIFSLGANSFGGFDKDLHKKLDKEFIRFLNIISSKSVSLGVRGNYTAEVLDKLGIKNVEPVGCPTFFETGRNRVIKKKKLPEDFKVLATGVFTNKEQERLYYALQDEKAIIGGLFFDKNIDLDNMRHLSNAGGQYIKQLNQAFFEDRVAAFSNMDAWKDYASNFDFSVGSRAHGSIIALNAGIPAILTNGDSRATEMAELFDIPHRPEIGPHQSKEFGFNLDLKLLYQESNFDKMNKNYNKLFDNFENWMKKNGLKIVKPSSEILIKEEFLKKNDKQYRKNKAFDLSFYRFNFEVDKHLDRFHELDHCLRELDHYNIKEENQKIPQKNKNSKMLKPFKKLKRHFNKYILKN